MKLSPSLNIWELKLAMSFDDTNGIGHIVGIPVLVVKIIIVSNTCRILTPILLYRVFLMIDKKFELIARARKLG